MAQDDVMMLRITLSASNSEQIKASNLDPLSSNMSVLHLTAACTGSDILVLSPHHCYPFFGRDDICFCFHRDVKSKQTVSESMRSRH